MTPHKDIPYVIAVDFDGTLCEGAYPDIGPPRLDIINAALAHQAMGKKLILWTCRTGDRLSEAVEWCEQFGLRFDAINANIKERIDFFGGDPRKVGADEYWDDRAVFVPPPKEDT